ncbi:MAG: hypothetical protein ACJ8A4_14335, partial [Microvirga sp.]
MLPLAITVSACASPAPPVAARLMATSFTSVPVRLLTVIVSAPPRALTAIFSTPLTSMVMLAMSRVSRAWLPFAEMSIFSAMLAPL